MHSINANYATPLPFKRNGKQQGFTLIEVMIVVSIVGIIASLAAPNMSRQLEKRRVESAIKSIVTMHKEAQAEAKIRHKDIAITFSADDLSLAIGTSGSGFYKQGQLPSGVRIYGTNGTELTGDFTYSVQHNGRYSKVQANGTEKSDMSYCISTPRLKGELIKHIKYEEKKILRSDASDSLCS